MNKTCVTMLVLISSFDGTILLRQVIYIKNVQLMYNT